MLLRAIMSNPGCSFMPHRLTAIIFNDYLDFLVDSNKVWASNAYALIISFARTNFSYKR